MKTYLMISAIFFIFYYFYLGFYKRDREETYKIMKTRLQRYAGGKYSDWSSFLPDEVMYTRLSFTVILSSLFWPFEIIYWIFAKIFN